MKVFIDTDIGGDFDDAHALALALASPEIELVGVSTVGAGASAERRARVASSLLQAANRADISVFAGHDAPSQPSADLSRLSAPHILNAYSADMQSAPISVIHGVEAIVQAAEAHGPSLTLLTLGALTNIAAAYQRAPAAMRTVGRVVVMGGAVAFPWREANIAIDPHAADVVVRSATALQMVGYDVSGSTAVPLARVEQARMQTNELARLFRDMTRRYRDAYRTEQVTLCDVTALASIIEPNLVTFRPCPISIELDGRYTRGMTVAQRDPWFNNVPDATVVSVAAAVDTVNVLRLHERRVLNSCEL